jgi:uncharacterized MAPEG superfamily protein
MNTSLLYLTYVILPSALLWVPYILNELMVRGVVDAAGRPQNSKPLAPWAVRMNAAHFNAIENLAIFATLVLVATALHMNNHAID